VATLHEQLGEDLRVHAAEAPEDFKQVRVEKRLESLGATVVLSTAASTSPLGYAWWCIEWNLKEW
jgi:hypothetical protein